MQRRTDSPQMGTETHGMKLKGKEKNKPVSINVQRWLTLSYCVSPKKMIEKFK